MLRGGAPPSSQGKCSVGFSGGSQWVLMGTHENSWVLMGSQWVLVGSQWVLRLCIFGFSCGSQAGTPLCISKRKLTLELILVRLVMLLSHTKGTRIRASNHILQKTRYK